jgi:hypothetical protein
MMTTVAIFSLVVIAMVSLQIFGFKMNSFTTSKLKSTADSLKTLNQIRNQIREAQNPVLVGSFNVNSDKFTAAANGQAAIGNAIQISNGPNSLVTFYLDTNTFLLYEEDTSGLQTILAHAVINQQPFQAQDYLGSTIPGGSSDRYTIKITLLFSNLNYSAPTLSYNTYSIKSRATPRIQD